jgi:hypothetical protein
MRSAWKPLLRGAIGTTRSRSLRSERDDAGFLFFRYRARGTGFSLR